jgi:hypothetical protein
MSQIGQHRRSRGETGPAHITSTFLRSWRALLWMPLDGRCVGVPRLLHVPVRDVALRVQSLDLAECIDESLRVHLGRACEVPKEIGIAFLWGFGPCEGIVV